MSLIHSIFFSICSICLNNFWLQLWTVKNFPILLDSKASCQVFLGGLVLSVFWGRLKPFLFRRSFPRLLPQLLYSACTVTVVIFRHFNSFAAAGDHILHASEIYRIFHSDGLWETTHCGVLSKNYSAAKELIVLFFYLLTYLLLSMVHVNYSEFWRPLSEILALKSVHLCICRNCLAIKWLVST